jgi:hypothetical protein
MDMREAERRAATLPAHIRLSTWFAVVTLIGAIFAGVDAGNAAGATYDRFVWSLVADLLALLAVRSTIKAATMKATLVHIEAIKDMKR